MNEEERQGSNLADTRCETAIDGLPQRTKGLNPAAPQVEPPVFVRALFNQFGHPSGWLGQLAGLLMSRTTADDHWVVDLLDVQRTDRVLDVGCGPGVLLQLLAERAEAGFVAGVDPSEAMLRQASRRDRYAIRQGRMMLRQAAAAHLPFANGSFDTVAALHSIYFWPSLEEGLHEIQRVLRPGGRVVIAARMQHHNAGCLDPSRYGLSEERLDSVVRIAASVGFNDVIVKRQAGLDRQTMAAIAAHT